jgi:glycyl-tRNA synthetase
MLDKSERIEKLTGELVTMLGLTADEAIYARLAAHLSKADLVSRMVVEMTSLQGVMGREYALRSGEHQAVADAIGEQYQPVPYSKPGIAMALADRLDSLAGLFSIGMIPTGTKDPFGLRRAAIGIVQPLIEHKLTFNLLSAVNAAAALQPVPVNDDVQGQVMEFLTGRLRVVLLDKGYKHDIVDAVLALQAENPAGAISAVIELTGWVARKDWSTILPAYARCVRITRDQKTTFSVNPNNFIEDAERNLYSALEIAEKQPHSPGKVDDFLSSFIPLIPPVNAFFDKVLVMSDNKTLQENRLGLLQRIAALAGSTADLSKLEGF